MTIDIIYMKRALELAKKGVGMVSPNPLVGAVIVKDDAVIGEGYHAYYGGNHAEIEAIKNACTPVSDATIYVTLEPCAHHGKTPPCVDAILDHGIRKVVVGALDPNPLVNGRGVKCLKENGVEVVTGVLEEECNFANRYFFKFIRKNLPYLVIKCAETSDHKISVKGGGWFTSEESRRHVHLLRSEIDAVLVGVGTVLSDNPRLTVRTVSRRNPKRIVLDPSLRAPERSNLFYCSDIQNTWIFVGPYAPDDKITAIKDLGARITPLVVDRHGRFDLKELLAFLAHEGISSVLVEGGRETWTHFFGQDLVDEVIMFSNPAAMGNGWLNPAHEFMDPGLFSLQATWKSGGDTVSHFVRNPI